jgi:hypothetical protein
MGQTSGAKLEMKKLLLTLALTLLPVYVQAQTATHSVTVSWKDATNPAGTEYNIYRLLGSCPVTAPTNTIGFTKLNPNPISGFSYIDTAVVSKTTYCYLATSVNSDGTGESGVSNDAQTVIPSLFPPTMLQVTTQ